MVLHRLCLLAALVLAASMGCASKTQHGDATLVEDRPIYSPKGFREWRLTLPVINLSEPGTRQFRIRRMPHLHLNFDLLMVVPEAESHRDEIALAPWSETTVTVTVLSPGGATMGTVSYKLGKLFGAGFGGSEFEDLQEISELVPVEGDYDLTVRVDHPSTRRGDRMRIRALATTDPALPNR